MKKYSKLSMAAVLAASALVPVAAFAAEPTESSTEAAKGFYNISKDAEVAYYSIADFKELTREAKIALLSNEDVYLVANGKVFSMEALEGSDEDLLAAAIDEVQFEEDNGLELSSDGEIIFGDEIETELVVESVSAITTTIKQAADQQLAVSVNEGQEATVEELEAAGYTVAFAYTVTASDINKATGVVDASKAPFNSSFEYQVTVSKDGEKVAESTWTEVKALAATTAVKVLEVELQAAGKAFPTSYITEGDDTTTIVATKAENAFGETEGVVAPTVKNIVSSDATVVSFEAGELNARKAGTVTLTVEFVGIEEKVTYELEVKAGQVPVLVESGQTTKVQTIVENSVEISLVDQYGEALRSDQDLTYILKDATGLTVATTTESVTAGEKGEVTFTLAEAGNYTVEVENDDKVIGTLNLQGVAVDATKIDTFTLTSAESELDLKGATDVAPATLAVTTNGFVDGVKVSQPDVDLAVADKVLVLKSSNEKVATVAANGTVTAIAEGTTTISLVKVEGQKVTTFATYDVTVKNTTVQVDTLTLKGAATALKVKDAADIDAAFIAANVTAGKDKDGEEIFKASMIKNVEYVASNSQVIVTINDINGGKDFVFDVVEDEAAVFAALTGAAWTVVPVAAVEAVNVGDVLTPEVLATEADVVEVGDVLAPEVLATEADVVEGIAIGDELEPAVLATEADVVEGIAIGDELEPAVLATAADVVEAVNLGDTIHVDADQADLDADLLVKIGDKISKVADQTDVDNEDATEVGETIYVDADQADLDADLLVKIGDKISKVAEAADVVEAVNVGDVLTPAVLAEAADVVEAVNVGDVLTPAVLAEAADVVEAVNVGDVLTPAVLAEAADVVAVGDVITAEVLATEADVVEAVVPVNGSLVFTFSEAINIGEDAELTFAIDGGTTTATVKAEDLSADKKTLTITVAPDSEVVSATTVTAVTGVTDAATGNVVTVSAPIDISLAQ